MAKVVSLTPAMAREATAVGQDDCGFFGERGVNSCGNIGIGNDACVGAVESFAAQEIYCDAPGSIFIDTRGGARRSDDDEGGALWAHSG